MKLCPGQRNVSAFSSCSCIRFWPSAAVTFIYVFRPSPGQKWWLHDKSIYLVPLTFFLPSWLLELLSYPCRTVPRSRKTSKYCITYNIQNNDERMKFCVCVSVWEQCRCAGPSSLCLYVSQRCPGNSTRSQSSYVIPCNSISYWVSEVCDYVAFLWGCLTAAASIHRQANQWDEGGGQPGGHPADGFD